MQRHSGKRIARLGRRHRNIDRAPQRLGFERILPDVIVACDAIVVARQAAGDRPLNPPAAWTARFIDLVGAVNAVLKRLSSREDQRDIFEDAWSVSEKIQSLVDELGRRPRIKFSELFQSASGRTEIVVTFLALLELIRLKQVSAVQPEAFGEIEICLVSRDEHPPAAAPDSGDAGIST